MKVSGKVAMKKLIYPNIFRYNGGERNEDEHRRSLRDLGEHRKRRGHRRERDANCDRASRPPARPRHIRSGSRNCADSAEKISVDENRV